MCNQMYIHFSYCPHILIKQHCCHEDPTFRFTILFCQDYCYERTTLRDACPRKVCQQRKQQMLVDWTWDMHESINEVASQKQEMRESLGIPDMIQQKVAEIDAEQQAFIEDEKRRLAALALQQEELEFRQRLAASQVQTHEYHPGATSLPPSYMAATSASRLDLSNDDMHYKAFYESCPQHRSYHTQSFQWHDEKMEGGSALATLDFPTTVLHRTRLPAIRFGAHGGIVKAPTSQLGPRAPMPPRSTLNEYVLPAMPHPRVDSAVEMSSGFGNFDL